MDDIQNVRVVEVVPNYANAVKLAVVGGIATVLVTEVMSLLVQPLVDKAKLKQLQKANKKTQDIQK